MFDFPEVDVYRLLSEREKTLIEKHGRVLLLLEVHKNGGVFRHRPKEWDEEEPIPPPPNTPT